MNDTNISWTDLSINPIRARSKDTGGKSRNGHFCQKYDCSCAFCYAGEMQGRFGMPNFPGRNKSPTDSGIEVWLDESRLQQVMRQKRPAKVFWCDMTDAFGDWVHDEWLDKCFAVMSLTPHLIHQVLTKRTERMRDYLNALDRAKSIDLQKCVIMGTLPDAGRSVDMYAGEDGTLLGPNIWLGTSCGEQGGAYRIDILKQCPAAVRFVSYEPAIGPLRADLTGISWLIAGGESGRNRRPCEIEWFRAIHSECQRAGTAFWMKQDSALRPGNRGRIPDELWVHEFPKVVMA